ncbi:MAG: L-threonylcarbamoyladenylate synthase [Moraxellaceae bacterium]|nr:L-threonylcarbamoyladenylate synthase [Moraxellaceae bacterium]MDZ4298465.1 L-threonylcarbamoyladenylate synthase [Moraxellaceae bacterium]MDZ4387194.1 L-threonylcarbamoyladenylate synthase [Moraxellaceae bacterium]
MTQHWHIHPDNPQPRLLKQAAERLQAGGLIVLPTDASYVLACQIGDRDALERMRRLRKLDDQHHMTLMCRDLSEIGTYAKVDNPTFRLLKAHTPGTYTFILNATREVPKRLMHPKRQSIGIRVPAHPVPLGLMEILQEPLLTCSLIMPGDTEPMDDPEMINDLLQRQVELVLNAGFGTLMSTTVIDLTGDAPEILRQGAGDSTDFA